MTSTRERVWLSARRTRHETYPPIAAPIRSTPKNTPSATPRATFSTARRLPVAIRRIRMTRNRRPIASSFRHLQCTHGPRIRGTARAPSPLERGPHGVELKTMIWVGTSGWQYRDWKGAFYPEKLPQRLWLQHHATQFPAVEVNNSFYMLPKEQTFDRWRASTPDGFAFAVKASRYITHIRRLREAKDSVDLFWSRATRLGEKLGPVLFQLPPNFAADAGLLEAFVSALPASMRAAFEFRDPSWESHEVAGVL